MPPVLADVPSPAWRETVPRSGHLALPGSSGELPPEPPHFARSPRPTLAGCGGAGVPFRLAATGARIPIEPSPSVSVPRIHPEKPGFLFRTGPGIDSVSPPQSDREAELSHSPSAGSENVQAAQSKSQYRSIGKKVVRVVPRMGPPDVARRLLTPTRWTCLADHAWMWRYLSLC